MALTKADILEIIENAQAACIDLATGNGSYEEYQETRSRLLSQPSVKRNMPDWLMSCRSGGQFWALMKETAGTYQERRKFIWTEFAPLFESTERQGIELTASSVEDSLKYCTSISVNDAWQRCQERRFDDPEGAITAARTMLESVCKFILEERQIEYNPKGDLVKLYKRTANVLKLSPSQHNEQIFKQILTGCSSIVEGLASLRNTFGDAHGKGARPIKPSERHAGFAVNLAGTVCSFLIQTYELKYPATKDTSDGK